MGRDYGQAAFITLNSAACTDSQGLCKLSDGGRQRVLLTAVYTRGGSFMYNKNKSDLIALEFISPLHFMRFCTSIGGFVCRFCFLT